MTPDLFRRLELQIKNALQWNQVCGIGHKRYFCPDPDHPGWNLVGCEDCNIHYTVADEQLKEWESASSR